MVEHAGCGEPVEMGVFFLGETPLCLGSVARVPQRPMRMGSVCFHCQPILGIESVIQQRVNFSWNGNWVLSAG